MLGDHIRTLKAGRWTHAIDCGDETVIVLARGAAEAPHVRRSYRPEFVAGAETVEIVRHRERTFSADEVVARAYSRISDPALASMFRDSEAFAEWCTTGRVPNAPANVAISVPGVAAPARSEPPPERSATAKRPRRATRKPAAKAKAKAKATRAKPPLKARAARVKPAKPARKVAKARGSRIKANRKRSGK